MFKSYNEAINNQHIPALLDYDVAMDVLKGLKFQLVVIPDMLDIHKPLHLYHSKTLEIKVVIPIKDKYIILDDSAYNLGYCQGYNLKYDTKDIFPIYTHQYQYYNLGYAAGRLDVMSELQESQELVCSKNT